VTKPGDDGDETGDGPDLAGLAEQFRTFHSAEVDAMTAELASLGPVAFLRQHQERALVCEAEDAAQGWRAVTITHGDIDSAAEMAAVQAVVDHARFRSPRLGIIGGSDYVTLRIPGPGADDVVSELAEMARAHRGQYWWWQVDLSSRPQRR
jgi:hypothetical protein